MNKSSKNIIILSLVLLIIISYYFLKIKEINEGNFVYVLDDAYIHLSIAKNFFYNFNWGINPYEFQNSSSSPLWTLLLSLFKGNLYIPFLLNTLITLFVINKLYNLINKHLNFQMSFFLNAIIVFLTPIIPLIFTGLEHLLHILLLIYFFEYLNNFFTSNKFNNKIYLFAFILPIIRLESIFLIIPLLFYLLLQRNIKELILLIISSSIFIISYGIFSINKGWLFFPNSIYLKSTVSLSIFENFFRYITQIPKQFYYSPHLIIILPLLIILKQNNRINNLVALIIITTLLHLEFARTNWFYRYEAYLIILIFITLIINFRVLLEFYHKYKKTALILSLILFVPLFYRGVESHTKIIGASNEIYSQPIQLAKFINKYYDIHTIGLNDIGAISYYTNANIIDLWGLSNIEIAKKIKNNIFNPIDLVQYTKKSEFIAVFEHWFENKIKNTTLIKVANLEIDNSFILGSNYLTLFVSDSSKANKLKANLISFQDIIYYKTKINFFY